MNAPFKKLENWLAEERAKGNIFPQGAVLCTVSNLGMPRSRVVSTMLDEIGIPKFHTSPASRKIEDIDHNNSASLTYSFQNTLRSISIEGNLTPIDRDELESDWLTFDKDFRRHYLVFGESSGADLDSLEALREKRDNFPLNAETIRPDSFIGFKFSDIRRVSFYSVQESDFAISTLYELDDDNKTWLKRNVIP